MSECVEFALRRCGLRHSLTLKPEQLKSVEVVLAGSHLGSVLLLFSIPLRKTFFSKARDSFSRSFHLAKQIYYAYLGHGHARQTTGAFMLE